jgi:ADP-ribose pyrophosphatase YjhB (NUDIX family)
MKVQVLYKSAVTWKGQRCDVVHCSVSDFSHIPHEKIQKVHGVCFRDGKMLVVYHNEWDIWGIPGGTREENEGLLETLTREIQEESSCLVLNADPIAYQEIKHNDGTSYYALFYYCETDIQGVFHEDITGTVTKQEWIDPEEYHKYIEDKPFRKRVIEDALIFRKHNLFC